MRAGRLNRRVQIQKPGTTVDELGEIVPGGWVDAFPGTIAASILNKSGLESIKSDADVSIVKTSILVRYRSGITAGMRAIHGVVIYDILAVLPDEEDKENLYLVCQSGAISA